MSKNHKGRTLHFTLSTVLSRIGRRLSATHRGAFLHLPAFLFACTPVPEPVEESPLPPRKVQIYILQTGKTTLQSLDLLFFQEKPLQKLDAYQHFGAVSGDRVEGTSSLAATHAAAFSNCPEDPYSWSDVRTFASLGGKAFRLEDEDPSAPMMVGTADLPEGSRRTCRIILRTMLSRITLQSLACDFTGRSYAGEMLKDVRAYLTYARSECHPLDTADRPASWINAGRLDEGQTAALPHPEMLLADLGASVGTRIYPARDFFCYANPSDGKDFGTPVTRLVIEGRLGDTVYYYPIDLPGLKPGVQYRMDVTITRAGSTDPDIPVESGTVLLQSEVLPWDERELDDVHYR